VSSVSGYSRVLLIQQLIKKETQHKYTLSSVDVDHFAMSQQAVSANFIQVAEKSCLDWKEKEEFGLKKKRKSQKN
jgi:hypothetical protein